MKKLINKLIQKLIKKSVSDAVSNPNVEPALVPGDDAKKNLWKFILQTLISILTAIRFPLNFNPEEIPRLRSE